MLLTDRKKGIKQPFLLHQAIELTPFRNFPGAQYQNLVIPAHPS